VRQQLGTDERRRFDAAIEVDQAVALKSELLTYISGRGIEEVAGTLPPDSIDVIVSNAVLEEVQPLDDALNALDRIWRAGGIQIHKIDLRDYGMFTKHGFHPLEFLTIPDGIYRYMSESAGAPNRHLVDYYRHKMMSLGYDAAIYTTWVLGGHSELDPPAETLQFGSTYFSDSLGQVRAIRPQLLPRYRSLPDEDLITQGILIVARKPRGPTKPLEPRS
jgi:hypothetical protein